MSDPAELYRALALALAQHRSSHGAGHNTSRHTRNVIKILLWDHRYAIAEALKVSAERITNNG